MSNNCRFSVLDEARVQIAAAVGASVASVYDISLPQEVLGRIAKACTRVSKRGRGEVAFPCAMLCKDLKGHKPKTVADKISEAIAALLATDETISEVIGSCVADGVYINFMLNPTFLGRIVDEVLNKGHLRPLDKTKERVMVEYSQPNSHKAFHVGHMRNVALGDSLVRLYEHMGHTVVAVNYFGDEGAHVAKCLWLLLKRLSAQGCTIDELDVPQDRKGEFLGLLYTEAVEKLSLNSLTRYPYLNVVAAKVISVEPHPNPDAPKNWHKVVVQYQSAEEGSGTAVVVCGGEGYNVGDMVAYVPVGVRFNKADVVPKDMKGVMSSGIMLAYEELGETAPAEAVEKALAARAAKGDVKGKKAKGKKNAPKLIMVLSLVDESRVGQLLAEVGRLADAKDLDATTSVLDEHFKRKQKANEVLHAIEAGEEDMIALWKKTKAWSIAEFKEVYRWLRVRFDHDFYESEVGAESKEMCMEAYEKGILVKSDGAIGANLEPYGMPFCVLIKSDGAGLYATKDLALAHRKFREFNIDRSIYVVDVSQSLHFQQVFKTLELMGYEKAKNCYHLAYGLVVHPHGKMSSRKGTIIYFASLREQLREQIMEEYLKKYVGEWPSEEIDEVLQCISISTIKFRMLNVEPLKDIVFDLKTWTAKTGATGPYLMYGYSRIRSIVARVGTPVDGVVDMKLLDTERDRFLMFALSMFWSVVERSTYENNPSPLCKFLFELSRDFMSWYESSSVVRAETPHLQATRLALIKTVAEVLKSGMHLLGMPVVERM